jgi:hypothetical protein
MVRRLRLGSICSAMVRVESTGFTVRVIRLENTCVVKG